MQISVLTTDNQFLKGINDDDLDFIFINPDLLRPAKNSSVIVISADDQAQKLGKICQGLREQEISLPILIVGQKISSNQKTKLLRLGADDCLSGTWDFEELKARLRALARRPQLIISPNLAIGDLVIDSWQRRAKIRNKTILLTPKEFMILEYLVQQQNRLVSKEELIYKLWNNNLDPLSQVITIHIHNLRRKLSRQTKNIHLLTISGRGYCLKN